MEGPGERGRPEHRPPFLRTDKSSGHCPWLPSSITHVYDGMGQAVPCSRDPPRTPRLRTGRGLECHPHRSEEHTSELQSRENLVCRLLLEKKKKTNI